VLRRTKPLGPAFQRLLKSFETKAEFGRQVGAHRSLIDYWCRMGFIPYPWIQRSATACLRAGGRVTANELLAEADRYHALLAGLRQQGVRGRVHVIMRATTLVERPKTPAMVAKEAE
jgi:hypothetical protein